MRTDETIFLYTQPCVSGRARKTNRLLRRSVSRPRDIREYRKGFSRPIVCRNRSDTGHTPRKLPRFHEQSPASSHNTPMLPHRRLISISVTGLYVNSFFGIITEKFALFLCRAMIFRKTALRRSAHGKERRAAPVEVLRPIGFSAFPAFALWPRQGWKCRSLRLYISATSGSLHICRRRGRMR